MDQKKVMKSEREHVGFEQSALERECRSCALVWSGMFDEHLIACAFNYQVEDYSIVSVPLYPPGIHWMQSRIAKAVRICNKR